MNLSRRIDGDGRVIRGASEATFKANKLARRGRWARLRQAQDGVAIVEFTLAIMPVLCLFFAMMQWTICAYVNMLVKHAAVVAARAEAVMRPGMPDNVGAKGSSKDLEAAISPLFTHVHNVIDVGGLSNLTVKVSTQAKPCAQTMNKVDVTLMYVCGVPLGNRIVCSGSAISQASQTFGGPAIIKLTGSASFPNQGSYYEQVWSSQIGGGVSCSGT